MRRNTAQFAAISNNFPRHKLTFRVSSRKRVESRKNARKPREIARQSAARDSERRLRRNFAQFAANSTDSRDITSLFVMSKKKRVKSRKNAVKAREIETKPNLRDPGRRFPRNFAQFAGDFDQFPRHNLTFRVSLKKPVKSRKNAVKTREIEAKSKRNRISVIPDASFDEISRNLPRFRRIPAT